jgi:hypothetical protein
MAIALHARNVAGQKLPTNKSLPVAPPWRYGAWGVAAAAAVLFAIVSSRLGFGLQAILWPPGAVLSADRGTDQAQAQSPPRPSDEANLQLAKDVRALTEDRDRMMQRLAAIDQSIEDVRALVARQAEAVKHMSEAGNVWPEGATAPMTNAMLAAAAGEPLPGFASPLPPVPTPLAQGAESNAPPPPAAAPPYGADIGGASSIGALRARWRQIRARHPDIFEDLTAIATSKDHLRAGRSEFRLVVGPLPDVADATRLCASLAILRLACQPAMFDSRQMSLE